MQYDRPEIVGMLLNAGGIIQKKSHALLRIQTQIYRVFNIMVR